MSYFDNKRSLLYLLSTQQIINFYYFTMDLETNSNRDI